MLSDIILKIAEMEYAELAETHSYYPRPSCAGPERCQRQNVYWAMGESKKAMSGRGVITFDDSNWHEDLTLDWLRKSIYQVHSDQMPITIENMFPWMPKGKWHCKVCEKMDNLVQDYNYKACHGHIDWITTDIMGQDYLTEHKALSHFGFEGLMKGEHLPYDYLTQMALYFKGLQQYNPELTKGVLLVKNKNQSGYLEYLVEYINATDTLTVFERLHHTGDLEVINEVITGITQHAVDLLEEVDKHRKEGTLPERQYERSHWRCDYCPFVEMCWKGWADEHNELASDMALSGEVVDAIKYEREVHAKEIDEKKEKDTVRKEIKDMLKKAGVRSGAVTAEDGTQYKVDWVVKAINKVDTSLLSGAEKQAITVQVPRETLTIKKIEKKEEKVIKK